MKNENQIILNNYNNKSSEYSELYSYFLTNSNNRCDLNGLILKGVNAIHQFKQGTYHNKFKKKQSEINLQNIDKSEEEKQIIKPFPYQKRKTQKSMIFQPSKNHLLKSLNLEKEKNEVK